MTVQLLETGDDSRLPLYIGLAAAAVAALAAVLFTLKRQKKKQF